MTLVRDEAKALKWAARRLAVGDSLRAVASGLNEQGVKTVTGGEWQATALRRLVTSPRVTGRRAYRGRISKGDWPPILSVELQDKVIQSLTQRATPLHTSSPRKYLLTGGLLICGLCGNPLSSQPGRKRGYVCRQGAGLPGCGRIRIMADPIEQEAEDRVIARLASPPIRKRLAALIGTPGDFSTDRIHDAIGREQERLTELGQDYAANYIDRLAFHAASNAISERIEDLHARLAGAERLGTLPGLAPEDLLAWFETAPLKARRDLIATLLDHVVVHPATRRGPVGGAGLDEERLRWYWRA